MSKIVMKQDSVVIQPSMQNTIVFAANSGLGAISEQMNKWLQKNPDVIITQMVYENKVLLCLYEISRVVIASE